MDNKEARRTMIYLANLISVPMALHAAVKLQIADLVWQGGTNLPTSPKQLAGLIQTKFGLAIEPDEISLERILRVLASHGVFEEVPASGNPDARAFKLTDVGQTLVPDDRGLSLGSYILRNYQDALVQAWPHMYESLLDPSQEAFKKAHGVPLYEHYTKDTACNLLMQRAMSSLSLPFLKAVLESYDGFGSEGLKRIVDVGGSSGSCVAMIVERYPGLEGLTLISQKLWQMLLNTRGVLTSYGDEECRQVLENCHKALPENGKLILCDTVVPSATDDSERTRMVLVTDILLMTFHGPKCRNRTESEYRKLCEAAGFTSFRAHYNFDHFTTPHGVSKIELFD